MVTQWSIILCWTDDYLTATKITSAFETWLQIAKTKTLNHNLVLETGYYGNFAIQRWKNHTSQRPLIILGVCMKLVPVPSDIFFHYILGNDDNYYFQWYSIQLYPFLAYNQLLTYLSKKRYRRSSHFNLKIDIFPFFFR